MTRIFAGCIVKDEEDVIELCLRHASKFCSKIFVIDNNSQDSSWDIVNRLSREVPQLVPYLQIGIDYNDGMRAIPWEEYYPTLKDEGRTWWMVLDADEFFEGDPREYLVQADEEGADLVSVYQAQFYITKEDVKENKYVGKKIVESFHDLPYSYCINWKEPRFFKCRPGLEWKPFSRYPDIASPQYTPQGLSKESTVKVVNRHYQYQSIEQFEDRLSKRKLAFKKGAGALAHYQYLDDFLKPRNRLRRLENGGVTLTLRDELRVKLLQRVSSKTRLWLRRNSLIV